MTVATAVIERARARYVGAFQASSERREDGALVSREESSLAMISIHTGVSVADLEELIVCRADHAVSRVQDNPERLEPALLGAAASSFLMGWLLRDEQADDESIDFEPPVTCDRVQSVLREHSHKFCPECGVLTLHHREATA